MTRPTPPDVPELLIILTPLAIIPAFGMFALGAGLAIGQEVRAQLTGRK